MTNKCVNLIGEQHAMKNGVVYNAVCCVAELEECPKNRLKCYIGQACWQVRSK